MNGGKARRALALVAGAVVDAAAGLVAGAGTILWTGGAGIVVPAFILTCTWAALASHGVLVPGWVLAREPPSRGILGQRLSDALSGQIAGCVAGCAAAFLFLLTDSARLTAFVMPLAYAGGSALGPVRAQERDPRTAAAAPPHHVALGFAVGGAVAALLAAGGLWKLDAVGPP